MSIAALWTGADCTVDRPCLHGPYFVDRKGTGAQNGVEERWSMGMAWIFGLDGGGTSVRLRAEPLDGGKSLIFEGGSVNPRSAGWEGSHRALSRLFETLYEDRRFSPGSCRAGFAGIAGVGRTGDRRKMEELIRDVSGVECPLGVDSDALPALVGALGSRRGILLIAGTGSIALGCDSEGKLHRSGGWGHILGDEGSAYEVGREGLVAAVRARDGRGPATSLLESAIAHFSVEEAFGLIPAVYEHFDKAAIAGFARKVGAARDSGDGMAAAIMSRAADELALLVTSVAVQLGASGDERRIAMLGGLIKGDRKLKEDLELRLARQLPDFTITEPISDAITGACILAHEMEQAQRQMSL